MTPTLVTALQCAFLAMMPVVELRAALPWAIARGLDPWFSYILCVLFNMVPVPFILLFLNKILAWMESIPARAENTAQQIFAEGNTHFAAQETDFVTGGNALTTCKDL